MPIQSRVMQEMSALSITHQQAACQVPRQLLASIDDAQKQQGLRCNSHRAS